MNTKISTNLKFKRMFLNILSIFVILAMAFPVTGGVSAASDSPFVGHWEAIDVDGSDIRLSIGGPSSGPFQITWTESKDDSGLGFCEGGPGIIRGTGLLNEDDPFALEADLWVECFTIEKSMEFHLTFRYIPSTDTLATTYSGGLMVVFTHPRSPKASPAQVRMMTNYQEDWASGFYEEGHTVWLAVTESDGISVKATAEMVTGPQPGWDGGEIGFASQPWEWQPEQPDIVPNDWVYAWVDNGASAQMQVGEISAWVDLENDQVLGTVSAGWYSQEVYIYCFLWGMSDARDDMIMADGSEEFICSWSGGAYDIQPGDVAEVQYYGPDGHAVDYYLFIPNPRFTVFPEWEWFDGNDWPDGATVSITVEGKPECETSKESWGGFFNGSFGEGCDVAIGDTVTFTDGATVRTHTVRNLTVTTVDREANIVAGTADAGEVVYVWPHATGQQLQATADIANAWQVDFTDVFDLVEGTDGRSEIRDEQGNSTAVDWRIPNPHFSVFPEWEYIEGWEWPDGATVLATIEGKPVCSVEGTSGHPDWDPNTLFVPLGLPEDCDVVVGDVVTLTDGMTWRTHIVQNLAVTAVDANTNTAAGTADPGAMVHVWPHGYYELLPTADENGAWLADFNTITIDLVEGMGGRTEIRDDEGNATAVEWYIPNPRFVVFSEWEWFDGLDWPDGVPVIITVEGKPECSTLGTSSGGFFNGGFPEGCDVAAGDTVRFTDGVTTRTHIVQNLAITSVDKQANTVSGTADAGATVYAWVHEYGFDMELQVQNGTWLADFGSAGLDLVENMGGRAEIRDEFGNGTAVDWYIPNPTIIAHPDQEWVEGWSFQHGSEVELTIYDGDGSQMYQGTATAAPPDWDPDNPNAFVRFDVGYDLKADDHLWMTDGISTKDMIVTALMPTGIDPSGQIVYGVADRNSEVTLEHQGEMWVVTADPEGNWSATLPVIARGSDVLASQSEADGDMTRIAFHIPNPRIVASITEDWFYLVEFAPEATVNYSIYESDGGAPIWEDTTATDGSGFVWVDAEGRWDLEPGNYLVVLDGTSTKDLVVEGFTFDVFDLTQGILQGTVPAQEGRLVWVGIGFENDGWSMDVFTDADGNWEAEYGSPVTTGVFWVAAQIYDEDGDASELRPSQIINWALIVTSTEDILANDGVCTLREAVIAANTNAPSGDMEGECPAGVDSHTDTILLAASHGYSLTIDSTCGDDQACGDLDIWDNSAASDLVMIVDGNGGATISQEAAVDDRVLENHGAGVEIEGLTLTGGSAEWSGGGIFNTGAMVVSHSTITANSSPNDGGGGIANEGSMTLIGSTVSNNTSIHDGGGIANTGSLTIDASELFGNSGGGGSALANLPGGQVLIQNGTQVHDNSAGTGALFNYGTLNVIDSAVFNNIAEYGGGLSNWGGMLTVSNSSISDNSATASAGGIHNKDGGTTLIENGSIISGNSAVWDGGGINNWDGTVTITGSTVSGNSAVQSGGGVLNLAGGTLSVDESILANNTASSTEYSSGGALANWGGTISITSSSISGNISNWGGGVATHGGALTLDATTVSGNSAAAEGGGIFVDGSSAVSIQNGSTLTTNTAGWGGGISSWGSTLTIDASTISGNTAQTFGGGILNKDSGETTIQNGSVISGNSAAGGGGVHNDDWSRLYLNDSTISDNTATGYGGGIQNFWYGELTINTSLITGNTAYWGGGIYNLPRTSTRIDNSIISGNSASSEGGGIVVESSGYLIMTGSALLSNTSPGDGDAILIKVFIPDEVKVTASCIAGNGDIAVDNRELVYPQDFTGNWWGDAGGPGGAGPGGGDSVSDLIDFSGWLTEPPAICALE